jgi:4'-phosphopantetheinyl transferase
MMPGVTPILGPGDVYVLELALPTSSRTCAELGEVLDDRERERVSRFRWEQDAISFTCTRALLRLMVADLLGIRGRDVPFNLGPYGKPHLALETDLEFNVSHSGGLALLAFARGRRIGVDVERQRPVPGWDVGGFCSDVENEAIRRHPPEGQLQAFFRCWTRKEAYLKARGEGLGFGLERVSVSVEANTPALLAVDGEPNAQARWILKDLEVGLHHKAAVAVEAPCRSLAMEVVDLR